MDIPLVGEGEVNIPIRAECAVPLLTLSSPVVEFGDCFLRYPYKRVLRLTNESKLPSKFEIMPQVRTRKPRGPGGDGCSGGKAWEEGGNAVHDSLTCNHP